MSKLGWSLPAGCGALPGEEDEPEPLICDNCGEQITGFFDLVEPVEVIPWKEKIDGDIITAGIMVYYQCPKCGQKMRGD